MTCRSCGATIADKAIVCYRCGTPTAIPAAPARPKTTRPRAPWTFVGVVVAAVLVALALIIMFPGDRIGAGAVGGVIVTAAVGVWVFSRWRGR
jgi:hypothetical protein